MRKTATNAQIAMFPKSTIQRESRQRGSDFRIWENTIGRTLHHFARSCLKSERGLSRVSIGLLFDVLYLLVLFWTCLIFLFASQFHRSSFEDIQSDPRLEELSARLKENPGCTHDLPEYPAWTSNLHEFSWFHEWKAKQTQMFQVQETRKIDAPGEPFVLCTSLHLCTPLYIFEAVQQPVHTIIICQSTSVFWFSLASLVSFQVRALVSWSARSGQMLQLPLCQIVSVLPAFHTRSPNWECLSSNNCWTDEYSPRKDHKDLICTVKRNSQDIWNRLAPVAADPRTFPGEANLNEQLCRGGRKWRGTSWKPKNLARSGSLALVSKGWSSDASVQATLLSASAWEELWTEFFGFRDVPLQALPPHGFWGRFLVRRSTHKKNLPRKPCGGSRFFFESTFAPRTSQKTMWRFKPFFVSRPSHQRTFPENHVAFQLFLWVDLRTKEPSQKTMWRFKFFLWVDFRTKEPSQKPCGVSSLFCESTFAPKNLPKTMWRFKSFLSVNLRTRIFP